jgi:hypothetical protein
MANKAAHAAPLAILDCAAQGAARLTENEPRRAQTLGQLIRCLSSKSASSRRRHRVMYETPDWGIGQAPVESRIVP